MLVDSEGFNAKQPECESRLLYWLYELNNDIISLCLSFPLHKLEMTVALNQGPKTET